MAEIIWSPKALDDLEQLLIYISRDAPATAARFAQRAIDRVEQLSSHPLSGGLVPEDGSGRYRQLICGNYRILYRVGEDIVYIIAVHHAARLLDTNQLL